MKTLDVDLRSPSHPPRWAWAFVAVLGVTAIALVSAGVWQSRKLDALIAQRDALARELAAPVPVARPVQRKMPYDASAREMLALATSEWPVMLSALESVEITGVTLVSIEIAPAERWMRVDVEFADYATLLRYIDALNASEAKGHWSLMQAQTAVAVGGASANVASTASVKASW